jgi:adenylate cyclase
MGRADEAKVHKGRALELEPFEPFFASRVGTSSQDPDKALERILYAISLDNNYYFSHIMAASVYSQRKQYEKAIAEDQFAKTLSPDQTWSDVGLSRIFVAAGKPEEARAILDRLLQRRKSGVFVPPSHIAMVYHHLGDKEKAFDWLEKAYDIHDPKLFMLKSPFWKNVENEPRFKDIKRRVGL